MGQPNLQLWHKIKERKIAKSQVEIICNLLYFFLKKKNTVHEDKHRVSLEVCCFKEKES